MFAPRLAVLVSITMLAACSQEPEQSPDPSETSLENDGVEVLGSAILALADGSNGGSVSLVADADGQLSVEVDTQGIESGAHGFHLHETGACEGPDFKSAGGHLNPHGNSHGSESSGGMHLGDLPNLTADASGAGSLTAPIDGEQSEILNWMFDADGTAVVIHAEPDDYRTDPTGNAGARVACGVLTRL